MECWPSFRAVQVQGQPKSTKQINEIAELESEQRTLAGPKTKAVSGEFWLRFIWILLAFLAVVFFFCGLGQQVCRISFGQFVEWIRQKSSPTFWQVCWQQRKRFVASCHRLSNQVCRHRNGKTNNLIWFLIYGRPIMMMMISDGQVCSTLETLRNFRQ